MGLGSLSLGKSLLAITEKCCGHYSRSCHSCTTPALIFLGHPWSMSSPLISSPLLLYLSFFARPRHAVGPRVEVSLVSIVHWSMEARTLTSRTSAAAHEVAINILALGFRDQGDSGLAVAGVPRAGRMWADTCLPMIIQPWADAWQLPISETPLCRTAELRSPLSVTLRAVDPCRHKAGWS